MTWLRIRLRLLWGWWQHRLGNCPACASAIPECFGCDVCRNNRRSQAERWEVFEAGVRYGRR